MVRLTPKSNGHTDQYVTDSAALRRKVLDLRAALLDCVTPDDILDVVTTLLGLAKAGNLNAIRVLLNHSIGKAVDAPTEEDSKPAETQPAKVVLLDWRRKHDAAAESN